MPRPSGPRAGASTGARSRRHTETPPAPARPRHRPSLWWAAVRSGATAALAGAAAGIVFCVICWLPDAGVSGHPFSAIKAGVLGFLAAQHGGITVDGTGAAFLPLGMMLAVGVISWRAGRTLAEAADGLDETAPKRLLQALVLQAACYALACALLAAIVTLGTSHASVLAVFGAGFVLFALVSGVALLRGSELFDQLTARIPTSVRGSLRAALAAATVYVGAGTLLALGSLALHAGRVMSLSRQVGGGLSGFPVLIIGGLSVPNASIAGAAYLAGPGFAVGSGTRVNAFSTSHGLLPAFPLLGAVPDGHGANPVVLALMAVTPLIAGVAAAQLVRRAALARNLTGALSASGLTGLLTGCVLAILCWLAGGGVGPGRLHVIGASPWQVGVSAALQVAVVTAVVLGLHWIWDRFVPSDRDSSGPAADAAEIRADELASTR